mgnify:FL=1
MKNIKLVVAYDGTNYSGWQIQPNAVTIEQLLDKAINSLTGENIHVTGASRTDAGVHAMGNVAVFKTNSTIPGRRWAYAINRFLPDDIVVQASWEVEKNFHPRHCNTVKTYEYKILNTPFPFPKERNYSWHVSHDLNINKMKEAAQILVGEHDFKSFCCVRTQTESTVRHIYSIEIIKENIYNKNISEKFSNKYNNDSIKKNGDNNKNCLDMKASDNMSGLSDKIFGKNYSCDDKLQNNNVSAANRADNISNGSYITIRIKGNGFLYNMVRIIAGTLMQVGRGQLTPAAVQNMLLSKDRCSAGQTAPPQGLTLMGIDYVDGDDKEIV